jgi:hypothetical protein
VFTEIVPRARYRTMTVPRSAPASAPTPPSSLLERRLAGRPDLEMGTLRHLRDSLTLAIPSRQVGDSVFKWLSSVRVSDPRGVQVKCCWFLWCLVGHGVTWVSQLL